MGVSATDRKAAFGDLEKAENRERNLYNFLKPKPSNHQIDTKILMSIRAASMGLK